MILCYTIRCGNKYWLARSTSAPTMITTGTGRSHHIFKPALFKSRQIKDLKLKVAAPRVCCLPAQQTLEGARNQGAQSVPHRSLVSLNHFLPSETIETIFSSGLHNKGKADCQEAAQKTWEILEKAEPALFPER